MRILAFLDVSVVAGGGFNQALTAIMQMGRVCAGHFDFEVVTSVPGNTEVLQRLGVVSSVDMESTRDRFASRMLSFPWIRRARNYFGQEWRFPIEERLLARGADIVYFVGGYGVPARLRTLNYIYTIWDLCHRDHPEFPEVRNFGAFEHREALYGSVLNPAHLILTDSPQLVDSIARRYGVDRERMLPMPFAPGPFLDAALAAPKANVLQKYELDEGYLFYPAQFWAHKNHARLLEALVILRARNVRPAVVFAGSDQGNRAHVERIVSDNGLGDQVRFTGFVPAEDMRGLYEGCLAVVMPTYFGPTNIPPLEAWLLHKPLIYSAHLHEQVGNAALLAEADDPGQLATAIEKIQDPETRAALVRSGSKRLAELEQQRVESEKQLLIRLKQFEARRRCWS